MAVGFSLLQKVFFSDSLLTQLQDGIENSLNSVFSKTILDGVLVEGISLTTSFKNVSHGLGRPVRGYVLVKSDVITSLKDDDANNVNRSLYIKLAAGATATVSVWFF